LRVSEDAWLGDAQFIVTVNGHQLGDVQTVTASHAAGQSQTITLLDFSDTDISQVAVEFINDAWGGTPDTDRNLYVDQLTINGHVFQGENAFNQAGVTVGDSAGLFTAGSLIFDTGPDELTLRVSEDAWLGDAQFIVTVNGHQLGDVQTVTASHAAGQSQTITLLDFSDTDISQVAVEFINDAWGGTPDTDRNLYVDQLTINGHVFQGENAFNQAGVTVGDSAGLFTAGSLIFDTGPDELTLRVSEDAWLGDAPFIVTVNGHQLGALQTVTASHAAGQSQTITLLDFSDTDISQVAVDFINDAWGGTP